MNTTLASIIATLMAAQAVKSYQDSQPQEPQPFTLTTEECSVLHSEVVGVAGGIRAWHGATVATAEKTAESKEAKAEVVAVRAKFEEDCVRQDEAISVFTTLLRSLGLQ